MNALEKDLGTLAAELQKIQLWEETQPALSALMSTEPFCVDTLRFEQWLQWVFIPRLSQMAQSPDFAGLPNASDIHSMAEYAFKDYAQNTSSLCDAIKSVDNTLNAYKKA